MDIVNDIKIKYNQDSSGKRILTDHYVSIAGEIFLVRCRFPMTAPQYREYEITEAEAKALAKGTITVICPTVPEMRASKQAYIDDCIQKGQPVINRTKSEFENVTIMHQIADILSSRGILLMHGSVVVVDGKAYLFTAKSGTGKSTHTQLWLSKFGENAYILNDDRPLLKVEESGVTVFGSPWMGKHRRGINSSARLAGIAEIVRSADNRIEPVTSLEALCLLRTHSYYPAVHELAADILSLHRKIAEGIHCYRLCCNMEPEAADVAYEGMVQR